MGNDPRGECLDEHFINSKWLCDSRTPVTRTLKGNKKQFELAGVRVKSRSIEHSICHPNN